MIAHRQELRIAPLPKPEELAAFEAVVPGLAERIVKMAEQNGDDRRRNNRTIRWVTILGQVFAFIFGMTALGGGFYLVNNGQDTPDSQRLSRRLLCRSVCSSTTGRSKEPSLVRVVGQALPLAPPT